MQFDPASHRALQVALERPARTVARRTPTRSGPWLPLLSALLEMAGGKAELIRHSERAWASVTFSGSRHTVQLAFTGAEAVAAGEAMIEALSDHEFTIPRHLVADTAVISAEHVALPEERLTIEVELLLLDDC
ncbi:hypothetical protein [Novosphingobium sp.]|uniref:hypothetical protein n=1 Tax=Novosphingobium sp. TaxID=1874826 RepID=UPI0035B49982